MNAIALRIEPELPAVQPSHPTARFHEWRGACIDFFTRMEAKVADCLIAMSEVPGRGGKIDRAHLHGARLEALAAAVREGGPFATEGGKVAGLIEQCRTQADLRNMLCHGQAKVTHDEHGSWTATLHLAKFASSKLVRERLKLSEAEAAKLRAKLKRRSDQVNNQFGDLKRDVEAAPTMILELD